MPDKPTRYTPEQIRLMRDYAAAHDFTADAVTVNKSKFTEEQGRLYRRAEKLFHDEWKRRLPDFGVKDPMRNFSGNYPLEVLRRFDAEHLATSAAAIGSDPAALDDISDLFFGMLKQPLEAGFSALAKSLGKAPDDLTDEEIDRVIQAVADLFFEEMVNALMTAQNVEGVYGAAHARGTHEDFSRAVDNHDKIDFLHQWTHDRAKAGQVLSLEQVYEDAPQAYERALATEDPTRSVDLRTEEEVMADFLATIPTEEADLFLALAQQKTQAEIAKSLGITQGAVSKRIAKLKEKYKKFIKE